MNVGMRQWWRKGMGILTKIDRRLQRHFSSISFWKNAPTHRVPFSRMLKKAKIDQICHSRESGNPRFHWVFWIPAFAGMTNKEFFSILFIHHSRNQSADSAEGHEICTSAEICAICGLLLSLRITCGRRESG